jgi:hypothetical protein
MEYRVCLVEIPDLFCLGGRLPGFCPDDVDATLEHCLIACTRQRFKVQASKFECLGAPGLPGAQSSAVLVFYY